MENINNNDRDTAVSFERPRRRFGMLAGLAVLALAGVAAGGYAMGAGGEASAVSEATTTTLADEAATETTTGSEADTLQVDLSDNPATQPAGDAGGNDDDEPAPEPDPQPDPQPDPDPAQIAVDDTLDVETGGEGTFTIHNLGDEDLTIVSVTGPASVTFSDVPLIVGGGDSADVKVTVDLSGLAAGPYEMEVEVDSSAGSETVKLTGMKLAIIVLPPPSPDIDVQDQVVVPHLSPVAPIKIWNNEDSEVEVTLESLHPRLTLPAEATLVPGENVILGTITPFGVQPNLPMPLTFEVSWWLGSETATVLKIGQ